MLISPDEINKSLSMYGWSYKDKMIFKSFKFQNYMEGINFVKKIADISEELNHHPKMVADWCKVDIFIASHDLGGVTTKCVNLATKIESL